MTEGPADNGFPAALRRLRARFLRKGGFAASVLTLSMGASAAQALTILASPVLLRIYGPEELAVLALFMATANIVSAVATGRYELAVVLPESDRGAVSVAGWSMLLAVAVAAAALGAVALGGSRILALVGAEGGAAWLWWAPLNVLLISWHTVVARWLTRTKSFAQLARSRFAFSLVSVGAQIALGIASAHPAGHHLILGHLAGRLAALCIGGPALLAAFVRSRAGLALGELWGAARRYANFFVYSTPSGLITRVTNEMPTFFLNAHFSPTAVGLYALCARVVDTPIDLIATQLGEVFFQRSAQARLRGPREALRVLNRITVGLGAAAAPMALSLGALGPWLFALVFGERWRAAGVLAALLAPMFALKFIVTVTNFSLVAGERQSAVLKLSAMRLAVGLLVFGLGASRLSLEGLVLGHSLSTAAVFAAFLAAAHRLAREDLRDAGDAPRATP